MGFELESHPISMEGDMHNLPKNNQQVDTSTLDTKKTNIHLELTSTLDNKNATVL